jgi:hypothetical protein
MYIPIFETDAPEASRLQHFTDQSFWSSGDDIDECGGNSLSFRSRRSMRPRCVEAELPTPAETPLT